MPLQDVLSTLRQVVLDDISLSENFEVRKRYFCDRFPGLTGEEVEDFAKIPPERFKLYTGTIFRGERSVLVRHLAITFALLDHYWRKTYQKSFDTFALVKDMHQKRPWKNNTTEGLVECFIQYLPENLTPVCQAIPELNDIARLEQSSLKVARFRDGTLDSRNGLTVSRLEQLTVHELLQLQFGIPYYTRLEHFSYDVISLLEQYSQRRELVPLERQDTWAVAGRDASLRVRWIVLPEQVACYVSADSGDQRRDTLYPVSQFADWFIDNCSIQEGSKDSDEAELAVSFISLLLRLVHSGVVVVREL